LNIQLGGSASKKRVRLIPCLLVDKQLSAEYSLFAKGKTSGNSTHSQFIRSCQTETARALHITPGGLAKWRMGRAVT